MGPRTRHSFTAMAEVQICRQNGGQGSVSHASAVDACGNNPLITRYDAAARGLLKHMCGEATGEG